MQRSLFGNPRRWLSCLSAFIVTFCAYLVVTFGQVDERSEVAPKAKLPEVASPEDTDAGEPLERDEESNQPFDLDSHLQSFDQVWKTVADTHWDEKLIEEKWIPLKDKYRPQIQEATSVRQVRKIIGKMIEELGQSHFGIIQASAIDVIRPAEEPGDANAGIEFRLTDDGVVVWRVEEGSSASQAGVEPGWIVEKIGDSETVEVLNQIRAAANGPLRVETMVGLVFSELASGSSDERKSFRFVDRNAEVKELELELRVPDGQFSKFGHLPPIRVQVRKRNLPNGIGYIWFNAFLDPVRLMPQFRELVHAEENRAGIILDLRGNMGGLAGMTMGMASEFSSNQATLGTMTMKGAEIKFFVNANANPVDCPVAVLVDECSISSAEILAGGLQDLKLARVFGSRTAGLALPSVVVRLPNGDGFQYAMANYHSTSGKSLEMNGVTPDETVVLNRELLLVDPDPVLSLALKWIQQQSIKLTN